MKNLSRRRRLLIVAIIAVALLAAGAAFWWRVPKAKVLKLDLTNMDPAVVRVLSDALAEVGSAPGSAKAWGQLGAALMHYDFGEQAETAFEQATRLRRSPVSTPALR